jgi:hypothetical protein
LSAYIRDIGVLAKVGGRLPGEEVHYPLAKPRRIGQWDGSFP